MHRNPAATWPELLAKTEGGPRMWGRNYMLPVSVMHEPSVEVIRCRRIWSKRIHSILQL